MAARFSNLKQALSAIANNPRKFAGTTILVGALALAVPNAMAQTLQGYLVRPPKTDDATHFQAIGVKVNVPEENKSLFIKSLGVYVSGKTAASGNEYNLAILPTQTELFINGHRISTSDSLIVRVATELAKNNKGYSLKVGVEKPAERSKGVLDYTKLGIRFDDPYGRTVLTTTKMEQNPNTAWYAVRDINISKGLVASFSLSDNFGKRMYGGLGTLHFEGAKWTFEPWAGGFHVEGKGFAREGAQAGFWLKDKRTGINVKFSATTEFGKGREATGTALVRVPLRLDKNIEKYRAGKSRRPVEQKTILPRKRILRR